MADPACGIASGRKRFEAAAFLIERELNGGCAIAMNQQRLKKLDIANKNPRVFAHGQARSQRHLDIRRAGIDGQPLHQVLL